MRIHHRALVVTDLERSTEFYERHFGFRLIEQIDFGGERLAFLELEGERIELVEEPEKSRAAGPADHLAFGVEDLYAEVSRLLRAGVAFTDEGIIRLWNGARTVFCTGPDGELLELIEGTGGRTGTF